jgi:RNase P protein component
MIHVPVKRNVYRRQLQYIYSRQQAKHPFYSIGAVITAFVDQFPNSQYSTELEQTIRSNLILGDKREFTELVIAP